MTSIEELFRKPNAPVKRKFEAPSDPTEAYKATKRDATASPGGASRNGHASVNDAEDEDADIEAGPSIPPDDPDEDEDEEGRFFGGGVTRDAAQALEYIDGHDGEEGMFEEKIDEAWLRRLSTSFERKVRKNAELRIKYEAQPQTFMASEADVDEEIKSWSVLSEHPELYFPFVASGSVATLAGLLAHENTDIAIEALQIIAELLDEDVEAAPEQWDALAAALMDAELLELLLSNLVRLDETEESDRNGVYHSLSVLESLASQPSLTDKIGKEKLLEWLCNRVRRPEKQLSQNKQYAAEVLQVLLQSSAALRNTMIDQLDGIDLLLQLIASYRKVDPPSDSYEEEYAENLFDALICLVDQPEGKAKFVDFEGIELCIIMLKDSRFAKPRAIRLLDHAVGGAVEASSTACTKLVEAAGLKPLFHIFTKSKTPVTSIEHLLGIFASLLRHLPGDSEARIRVLNKFTEKQCEKTTRLCELRSRFSDSLEAVEASIRREREAIETGEVENLEATWDSRRLDSGLFALQMIDTILAWLSAEDAVCRAHVIARLGSLSAVKRGLQLQLEEIDPAEQSGAARGNDTRDMLNTLIDYLA